MGEVNEMREAAEHANHQPHGFWNHMRTVSGMRPERCRCTRCRREEGERDIARMVAMGTVAP